MLIKLVLSNSVGSIDHKYMTVEPDLGGYVRNIHLPHDWSLDHGDKIEIVFVKRAQEDGDSTDEDDRMVAALPVTA